MPNLFENATRYFARQARREFQRTATGQLVREVSRISKSGRVSRQSYRRISGQLRTLNRRGVIRELESTETGRIAGEVMRYARGRDNQIMRALFEALGPIGDVLRGLIRPRGQSLGSLEQELGAAANLLKAFGFEVKAPDRRPGAQRQAERVDDAQKLLESLGFTVTPPPKRADRPQPVDEPGVEPPQRAPFPLGTHREQRQVLGRKRSYDPNDPILTGEMIEVESSNVHSIGYLWNDANPANGTLQVRFLQSGRGGSKAPGPLYYYYNVHPDVFEFFRRASSKGEFVWDRLRVRGTVSGHRYPYELVGIRGGYVPRKATRYGPNEYYIRRRVRGKSRRTGRVREYESQLPDELVNRARPQPTDFGASDRGRPDRGR